MTTFPGVWLFVFLIFLALCALAALTAAALTYVERRWPAR